MPTPKEPFPPGSVERAIQARREALRAVKRTLMLIALFAAAYFCGLVAKERKKNATLEEEAQTGADDSATEK